nr:hypothetical protein [Grimontia marina]
MPVPHESGRKGEDQPVGEDVGRSTVFDALAGDFNHPFHPVRSCGTGNAGSDVRRGYHGAHGTGDQGVAEPAH